MLGFNGGLLGARRVPTVSAASGLWLPNEQSVAKRAGIWPLSAASVVPLASIVYTQANVYSSNVAASVANMQDGNKDTGSACSPAAETWCALDMGLPVMIDRIIVSAPGPNMPGGWSGGYIGGNGWKLQVSQDGTNWTTLYQDVNFSTSEQKTFAVSTTCRHVRHGYLGGVFNFYLAWSEFYPLSPGQSFT